MLLRPVTRDLHFVRDAELAKQINELRARLPDDGTVVALRRNTSTAGRRDSAREGLELTEQADLTDIHVARFVGSGRRTSAFTSTVAP